MFEEGGKPNKNDRNQNKLSICKGIQVRLQQNESLKRLELRFMTLNRQFLKALFSGLSKNKTLQKLIITHDVLNNATVAEFHMLGEALKANTTLLLLDLSHNSGFNDNMEFHSELTDCLINCPSSKLQKIRITAESIDVKAHYLDLID